MYLFGLPEDKAIKAIRQVPCLRSNTLVLEATRPGFYTEASQFMYVCPWANEATCLGFRFIISQLEKVIGNF